MTQPTERVQLHMALTQQVEAFGDWVAFCRCGWKGTPTERRVDARTEGDVHLALANGWPCAEGEHSHCMEHDSAWQPFADTCDALAAYESKGA